MSPEEILKFNLAVEEAATLDTDDIPEPEQVPASDYGYERRERQGNNKAHRTKAERKAKAKQTKASKKRNRK